MPKTLINETSEQYFTSLHDEKKFTNNTIMNGKCQWVGISHYVNGVLCKMLLRVAVYCYFFFFVCSTWQMQFTQHTKQVRIFNTLHNFIQKQLITFVSDIFLVILMNKYWGRSRYLNFFIKKFEILHFDLNWWLKPFLKFIYL